MTEEQLAHWLITHTSLTPKQAFALIPQAREWGMDDETIQAFGSDLPAAIEMHERSLVGASRRLAGALQETWQAFLDVRGAPVILAIARGVNRVTRFVMWARGW